MNESNTPWRRERGSFTQTLTPTPHDPPDPQSEKEENGNGKNNTSQKVDIFEATSFPD